MSDQRVRLRNDVGLTALQITRPAILDRFCGFRTATAAVLQFSDGLNLMPSAFIVSARAFPYAARLDGKPASGIHRGSAHTRSAKGHGIKTGFIGLGNVGGKLAGSLLRNGITLTDSSRISRANASGSYLSLKS